MRDARYVRLISWTLQSGSEQFIYNWNQTHADLDQGTGRKERTRQQQKQTDGNTSRVKVHANRQDKEILTTE